MTVSRRGVGRRRTRSAIFAMAFGWALPSAAELHDADLGRTRTVSEREWLSLRLQVMGLKLTYPAYRVTVELGSSNRVRFLLWISKPMAKHLQESGRPETERVLAYHAEGIRNRVEELLEADFPDLWADYDVRHDFVGEYMVPGVDIDTPPQRWARWKEERLFWER